MGYFTDYQTGLMNGLAIGLSIGAIAMNFKPERVKSYREFIYKEKSHLVEQSSARFRPSYIYEKQGNCYIRLDKPGKELEQASKINELECKVQKLK